MWNNVKTFLSTLYNKTKDFLLVGFAIISAVLLFILRLKSDKDTALQAQIDLAKTQKEADAVEADIVHQMAQAKLDGENIDKYQAALDSLNQKRKELNSGSNSNQSEENFWNNN